MLKGIIFDWAGTLVDYGSLCPLASFQAAFARRGIALEGWEVHEFMGRHKRDHLQAVLGLPSVNTQWIELYGRPWTEQDVDTLYALANSALIENLERHADPMPYAPEMLTRIRERGLKTGSTSGYTRVQMEKLVPLASARGVAVDHWVASDQVPQGRPWPWMIHANMQALGICPPSAIVKVGDTLIDIQEGLNAGVWTVGLVEGSSQIGQTRDFFHSQSPAVRASTCGRVREAYEAAGAHFVISNLSELDGVLDQIEAALDANRSPCKQTRVI